MGQRTWSFVEFVEFGIHSLVRDGVYLGVIYASIYSSGLGPGRDRG